MSNELTTLPSFTRNLFRHAFWVLPWFCRMDPRLRLKLRPGVEMTGYLEAIQQDRDRIFGSHPDLEEANDLLMSFYSALKPAGGGKSNQVALSFWIKTWQCAWKVRKSLQLRGHEVRLMKLFYQVFHSHRVESLSVLVAMARLIDRATVQLARSIHIPGLSNRKSLQRANRELARIQRSLFGRQTPTPELTRKVVKQKPSQYRVYRDRVRIRREAARLRIMELFDEDNWFPIVDVDILIEKLTEEGMDDLVPPGFRGRVSVQPSGYPLTFYTYAGLELEKPPLNHVEMNPQYGLREPDKKYRIHPISDGTFYCITHAAVGNSITKHYTLEYKRRARYLKFESVRSLGKSIEEIRERLVHHVCCDHRNTWVQAVMCLFMDLTCARIGNESSANGEVQTFGVTTFRTNQHLKVQGDSIVITYTGKHQQSQRHVLSIRKVVSDKDVEHLVAKKVLSLFAEQRPYLFTQDNGKPFTPDMVNDYFTTRYPASERNLPLGGAGAPCTVHNLRNYHATRMFMEFAHEFAMIHHNPTYEDLILAYQGCTQTDQRAARGGILHLIAEKLGNTPAICRRAYIDPREQLMFFRRWGYRPPDALIRDLYENEDADPYGLEEMLIHESTLKETQESVSAIR